MARTKTMRMTGTRLMDEKKGYNRIPFLKDVIFKGASGKKYRILSNEKIGEGGESQVFFAEIVGEKKRVVAKIYDIFIDTPANRNHRKRVLEFLSEYSDYKETHILPLLDSGWVEIDGGGDEPYKKPVDILPYCSESIKRATYSELREQIIPDVLISMIYMHKNLIVHRDIKPNNIMKYKGVIVLCDFGIASEVSSETNFHGTSTIKGSNGFLAPEAFQGRVTPAADYYSLGVTIATLYNNGRHVYQTLIDTNRSAELSEKMAEGLPLKCKKGEEGLQDLVDALTQFDKGKRAGYSEVLHWIENPSSLKASAVQRRTPSKKSTFRTTADCETTIIPSNASLYFQANQYNPSNTQSVYQPIVKSPSLDFTFEGTHYYTKEGLSRALAFNWEAAKKYLYMGGGTDNVLYRAFSPIDQTLAVRIDTIVEDDMETAKNYDLGLARLLHYLEDDGPLYWRGRSYNTLSDISKTYNSIYLQKDNSNTAKFVSDISDMLKSRYISWKLTAMGKSSTTVDLIKKIETLSQKWGKLATYYFIYEFCNGVQLPLSGKNADDIFKLNCCFFPASLYFSKVELMLSNDELLGYLCNLGFYQSVKLYKESLNGKVPHDLTCLYILYQNICADKEKVAERFIKFGPYGDLFYWQQDVVGVNSPYTFNSVNAVSLKNKISDIRLSEHSSITELAKLFKSLEQYQIDFKKMFQNNFLLAFIDIGNGKKRNGITSTEPLAFFVETFNGRSCSGQAMNSLRENYSAPLR